MAKLYAKTDILVDDVIIPKGQVFEGTPRQAKQFDALGAARPATDAEVKAAAQAVAIANAQD